MSIFIERIQQLNVIHLSPYFFTIEILRLRVKVDGRGLILDFLQQKGTEQQENGPHPVEGIPLIRFVAPADLLCMNGDIAIVGKADLGYSL